MTSLLAAKRKNNNFEESRLILFCEISTPLFKNGKERKKEPLATEHYNSHPIKLSTAWVQLIK